MRNSLVIYNDKIINLTRSIENTGVEHVDHHEQHIKNQPQTGKEHFTIDFITMIILISLSAFPQDFGPTHILLWLIELPISIHANTAMHTLSSLWLTHFCQSYIDSILHQQCN